MRTRIRWRVKLLLELPFYYRVKKGQTLFAIARACSCPPRVLASLNDLKEEVREGQILRLPEKKYDLYVVRGGESKTMLCGSPENFEARNRTRCLYPAQTVYL